MRSAKVAAVFTSIVLICIEATTINIRHRKQTEVLTPENVAQCVNPIPGLEWFQSGFDLTSIDLFSCPNITGIKKQIFDFNVCNERKRVYISDLVGSYDSPDNFIVLVQQKRWSDEDELFDKLDDVKSDLFTIIDAEEVYDRGIFSRSEYFTRFQKDLQNYTFVITTRNEELYEIDLEYYFMHQYLLRTFRRDYSTLPISFEENVEKYIQFIKDYGTHYMKTGQFGGRMRRLVAFERSKLNFSDAEMIAKARSLNFHIFDENAFIASHRPNKYDKNDEICLDELQRVAIYRNVLDGDEVAFVEQHNFGGKADKKRYEAWSKSIWRGIYLTGAFLRPISTLIGGKKEKEVEKAIKAYIARGYLDGLTQDLIYKLDSGIDGKLEEFFNHCLIKVNETIWENGYNLTAINMLINEIENGLLPGPPEPITKSGTDHVATQPSISVQFLPFVVVFVTVYIKSNFIF